MEKNFMPIRHWLNGKCIKTIEIDGVVCNVDKFTEEHNPGMIFDPMICAKCCFDSKQKTIKLPAKINEIDCFVEVGEEWYANDFYLTTVAPESTENKCKCRCIHNFVDMKHNCPQYVKTKINNKSDKNNKIKIKIKINGVKQTIIGKIIKK